MIANKKLKILSLMEKKKMFDFITADFPWIVVWLDWILYRFGGTLILFLSGFVIHYWYTLEHHSLDGLGLAMFVGTCAWVTYCALIQGYAVG